jgi:hypothetical protein
VASPTAEAWSTPSSETALQTSHDVNLPSGLTTGKRCIVVFAYAVTGNAISWTGTGFTAIANGAIEQTLGATQGIATAYRDCDGTEGATIVVGTNPSTRSCHVAVRISGHDSGTAPTATAVAGSNASADPPSLDAGSSKEYLWLACGSNSHGGTYTAGSPSGYSNLTQGNTGGTTTAHSLVGIADQAVTAQTENPGAFAGADAASEWAAVTIAIHPATGTQHTVNPPDTLSLSDALTQSRGLARADTLALTDDATPLLTVAIPMIAMPPLRPGGWR